MSKWLLRSLVFGLVAGIYGAAPTAARAQFDDASDPAYAGGLNNGTNGGTGFQPWILVPSPNASAGFFVFNSNNNGGSAGPGINSGANVAWGSYANGGNNGNATRPFNTPLSVGQTFGIQIDNGFIDAGASVGFRLVDSSSTIRMSFQFVGGDSNYTVFDAGGTTTTTLPFTDGGLNVGVDLISPTQYLVTATRLATGTTYQQTGSLIAGGPIDRFNFFNSNAGNGSTNDAYFNRIQIAPVPEPATVLLICGIAGSAVAGVRRYRKTPA